MPLDAPNVVAHLVMRGSRTVKEIAEAAGLKLEEAERCVLWLSSNGFLERGRIINSERGKHAKQLYSPVIYSIRVASRKGEA